jgi:hypothetical protein
VAENAAVQHLSEKGRLRNELIQQMRNVLLTFWHEGLFVTRAAAKRNDNHLPGTRQGQSAKRGKTEQSCACRRSRDATEKLAAMCADGLRYLAGAAAGPVQETTIRNQISSSVKSYYAEGQII